MTKNTYGTGSFVLVNLGDSHPPPVDGLLTTVAWQLGDDRRPTRWRASIFVTGAAVQWLRDGLGIIDASSESGPLAASVADTDGVVFVPAFTGLGSPWWDPYARGAVVRPHARHDRAHLARAVVEAMAWQTADVVDAIAARRRHPASPSCASTAAPARWTCSASSRPTCSASPVRRPADHETTALGAASLAGIAEGVWASPAEAACGVAGGRRVPARPAPAAPTSAGPTGTAASTAARNWAIRRLIAPWMPRAHVRRRRFATALRARSKPDERRGQPSLVRARLMPRTAWLMRCSFSTSAKRTNPSPPGPKPDAGRHRHLGLAHEQLGELEAAQLLVGLGDRAPTRTSSPCGSLDLPPDAAQPVDQRVAPAAVDLVRPRFG